MELTRFWRNLLIITGFFGEKTQAFLSGKLKIVLDFQPFRRRRSSRGLPRKVGFARQRFDFCG